MVKEEDGKTHPSAICISRQHVAFKSKVRKMILVLSKLDFRVKIIVCHDHANAVIMLVCVLAVNIAILA